MKKLLIGLRHNGLYLRALYWYYFKPHIIMEGIAQRKGKCLQCGKCCYSMLNLGIKCIFLKKNNTCAVHKFKKHSFLKMLCYYAPKKSSFRTSEAYKTCGYWWEETKKDKDFKP